MEKTRLALLWTALLLCVLPSFADEITIPDTAASADLTESIPIWVSEKVACDADGNLKVDLFHRHRIEDFLALRGSSGAEGCTITVGGPALEQAVDVGSIDSLAQSSRRIIRGDVVAQGEGFFGGTPGTLFAVRVEDVIGDAVPTPAIFFFLPVARIELANATICSTLWKDSLLPSSGDKLVVFVHFKPSDADGKIFEIDPRKQLFLQRGDEIRRPADLTSLGTETQLRDLMEVARQAWLRSAPERQQ